jgi:hypothetical protein
LKSSITCIDASTRSIRACIGREASGVEVVVAPGRDAQPRVKRTIVVAWSRRIPIVALQGMKPLTRGPETARFREGTHAGHSCQKETLGAIGPICVASRRSIGIF